jgi:hypothetical protein
MFDRVVNFNTKIKEAASFGQPISEYDSTSKGQADFRALAEEVIGVQSKAERHEMVNTLAGQLEKISSTADELLKEAKAVSPRIDRSQMREPQTPIAVAPVQPQPTSASSVRQAHGPSSTLSARTEGSLSRAVEPQKEVAKSLDEKLSDYYGVNQINGAVMFVSLYPHAKEVHIAGDFNNWHPAKTKMNKVGSSGIWQTKMQIGPGRYRYRLVVDGKWQQDPYNEMIEMNPYGEMNSILEVK